MLYSAYADYLHSIDTLILNDAPMISKAVVEANDSLMKNICQSLFPFGKKVFV